MSLSRIGLVLRWTSPFVRLDIAAREGHDEAGDRDSPWIGVVRLPGEHDKP